MNTEPLFDLVALNRFLDNPNKFKVRTYRNNMYNDKLQNKQQLTTAIKGGHYVVGSFSESQGFSFSSLPAVHYSVQSARNECKRLAKQTPNKTYIFVKLMGGEETITQPQYNSF